MVAEKASKGTKARSEKPKKEIYEGDILPIQFETYFREKARGRAPLTIHERDEMLLQMNRERCNRLFTLVQEGFAQYQAVYEANGKLVDIRVLEINPAGARISGVPRESQIGKTWREVWPNVSDQLFDRYREADETGEIVRFDDDNKITGRIYDVVINRISMGEFIVTFNDITERKETERDRERLIRELNEERTTLEVLVESLPVGVWVGDASGKITLVNAATGRIYGGKAPLLEKVEDYGVYKICKPGSEGLVPVHDYPLARALRGERLSEEVYDFVRFDGTQGTQLASSNPIIDPSGSIVGGVAVAMDITDLRKARKELEQNEEKFRLLFENMTEGMAHCKMIYQNDVPVDWIYLDVNPAFERITGFKKVSGKNVNDLLPDLRKTNPEAYEIYGRVARNGSPEYFETFVPELKKYLSISVYSNKKDHFVAVFNDITERKRAMEELQRQAALIDLSPDAIIVRLLDGTITFWSDGASRMYGWTSQEAIGRSTHDILKTDFPIPLDQIVDELSKEGKWNGELIHYARDGRTVNVLSYWSPQRDEHGKIKELMESNVDITTLKKFEENLKKSQERYRLAEAVANIGTFEWDLKTNINTWTHELEAMYGLKPGEFGKTQRSWENLIFQEDRKHAIETVNRTLMTGEPVEDEWRVVWPDGSVHWINGRFQAFNDESGKPIRMIGVNIDITRNKEIEAAFKKSEEKYRLLFHNMGEGFALYELIIDSQGKPIDWRVLEVNDAYVRNTGLSRSSIEGKRISELFPESIPHYIGRFYEVVRDQKWISFDTYASAVDRYQHVTCFPAGDNRFANIVEDITERKKAEKELHESEERYRSIFEESQAVMLLVDPVTAKIIEANSAASVYYGYSRDDLRKMSITDLDPLTAPEFFQEMHKESMGERRIFTFKHRLASGKIRDVDVYTGSVPIQGKMLMHLIVFDVTEKKEAEQDLINRHLQWA